MADKINTGGGAAQEGDTETGGGDWTGRDRNDHRWDNRRSSGGESNVHVNLGGPELDARRRGESTNDWVMRALLGDERLQQTGLIGELRELSRNLSAYIAKSEDRFEELERRRNVYISPQTAFFVVAVSVLCLVFAGFLVYWLANGGGR